MDAMDGVQLVQKCLKCQMNITACARSMIRNDFELINTIGRNEDHALSGILSCQYRHYWIKNKELYNKKIYIA